MPPCPSVLIPDLSLALSTADIFDVLVLAGFVAETDAEDNIAERRLPLSAMAECSRGRRALMAAGTNFMPCHRAATSNMRQL